MKLCGWNVVGVEFTTHFVQFTGLHHCTAVGWVWPVFLGPFLLGGFVVAHMLVRHGAVSPHGESIQSGGFNDKLYF